MAVMRDSTSVNIEPFGEFIYQESERQWFALVKNISSTNEVEVSIEVINSSSISNEKILLVKEFVDEIDETVKKVFEVIHKKFFDDSIKNLDEVKQMYFLTTITLKNDDATWWVVFEPTDVESIYNHFLRFTLINKEIVWTNFT